MRNQPLRNAVPPKAIVVQREDLPVWRPPMNGTQGAIADGDTLEPFGCRRVKVKLSALHGYPQSVGVRLFVRYFSLTWLAAYFAFQTFSTLSMPASLTLFTAVRLISEPP